jgi:parallel beta-helix repeat protein
MWMAFYSNGAYDIVIDGTEYHNNIKYALDPHTGTHDMNITNNYLHDNRIGAICSDRCYNILIEGNAVYNNTHIGIFFSRNMHDLVARDNHISNSDIGIEISESPDNQIYNNTIEGTTSAGILLRNPQNPDDGLTKNNQVYNNTITSFAGDGIRETRSHNNILRDNKLYTVPLQ